MASKDDVPMTTVTDEGAGMSQEMPKNDKVAVTTASNDRADMPMAIDDEVATPTASEMDGDQMCLDDENQSLSPSLSHGQIDGNADTKKMLYVEEPDTMQRAQMQGLARLTEIFNDPDEEIAHHIKSTIGWLPRPLSSNDRCRKVQNHLTGKNGADVTDESVPLILATWCMLGGYIPSMWREKVENRKSGTKELSERGKKMLLELERLGGDYEFEFCKRYAKMTGGKKPDFDYAKASEELMKPDYFVKQTRTKSKRTEKSTSLGKHRESSPRQHPAAKRPKTVAPQRSRHSYVGDDDTEDEQDREVDSDSMGGGKKKGLPVSKTPSRISDFNRSGLPFTGTQMPRHDHRGQVDVPRPPQQIWAFSSAQRGQGLEDTPSNSSIPRPFGPDLNTSNISSTTTSLGWNSQRRRGDRLLEERTAPGGTTGMPSSSYRYPTESSGQPLLEIRSALQQGPTTSPGRSPLNESTPASFLSGVQQGDLSEDRKGFMAQSSHAWAFIEQIENLKVSAQNEVNEQIDHYKSLNSNLKKELSVSHQNSEAKDDKIAALEQEVKVWRHVKHDKEQLESRITELEAASKRSRQRENRLKRTSVLNILQKASTTGKELGTIFLAQLLDEMDGGDGTCASGAEGS